jgi:hypothetical protein
MNYLTPVILSEAKDVRGRSYAAKSEQMQRSFAALRMTDYRYRNPLRGRKGKP